MADDLFGSLSGNQDERSPSLDVFVEQSESKTALALKVMKAVSRAKPKILNQRGESMAWEKMYDGHQWDDIDKMYLEQLRRPTIVFNEIKPTINAISGIERLNRPDMKFVARPLDSNPQQDMAGDLASEAYATVLDMCEGDAERSRAIKDMSVGGMGFIGFRMDYDKDPDGQIIIERLPWRECLWDVAARKENLGDAQWMGRERDMPRDRFKARFGEKMLSMVDIGTPDYEEEKVDKYELVTPYYSQMNEKVNPQVGDQGPTKNTVRVVQYQWAEMQTVYRLAGQGGIEDLTEEEYRKLRNRSLALGVQAPFAVKQSKLVYQECFMARGVIVEGPNELVGGFGIKCITGEWDEDKKIWYGIVKAMVDPQKTMNKSMSTALTMFLTNAKGGVMFETGSFADPQMAKDQWAKSDAWIEMNEGGAERVVQRQPLNYQGTTEIFFSESKAAMNYCSGIPADMLPGLAVGEASAPTITKRVQAALSVLGWYFDNITRLRKDEARTCLAYIREYWSQGQLIRVGGQINGQAVPLLKQNLPTAYDLMLDDSARHNPNLKAQIWQDIQPLVPAFLKTPGGMPILIKLLKFTPLPAMVVQEIEQMMNQQAQDPNSPQNQQKGRGKQEDPGLTQAKIAQLTAQAQKTQAETQQLQDESGLRVAEIAIDTMTKREELRQKDDLQKHRQVTDYIKAQKLFMGQGTGKTEVG